MLSKHNRNCTNNNDFTLLFYQSVYDIDFGSEKTSFPSIRHRKIVGQGCGQRTFDHAMHKQFKRLRAPR